MNDPQPVTMWEARAADGQLDELLAWVSWRMDPAAQVYRSRAGDPRLVVIDPSGTAAEALAQPPAHLLARPPHAWNFEEVRNG
jgi:hypothetical protein